VSPRPRGVSARPRGVSAHPRGVSAHRPELAALSIADPPARWRALGFTIDQMHPRVSGLPVLADREAGEIALGGVSVILGGEGSGITRWTLRHAPLGPGLDGLPTEVTSAPAVQDVVHPNGALGVDHVVIVTPDFDGTAAALAKRGLQLRRTRQAGDRRQGFRRLGPTIMELVEAPEAAALGFWGLTIVVSDLEALARQHAQIGEVRSAVQPGRHIATVDRAAAGLSTRLAFMDPE
jgi:hypothetical protein